MDIEKHINWNHKYSLDNWVKRFNLYCAPSIELGIVGSLFFVGYISTCLFIPQFADRYGRKVFVIGVCFI